MWLAVSTLKLSIRGCSAGGVSEPRQGDYFVLILCDTDAKLHRAPVRRRRPGRVNCSVITPTIKPVPAESQLVRAI